MKKVIKTAVIRSLLILMIFNLNAQVKKDTIFLLNEKHHRIYIDPNKTSKFYTVLENVGSGEKVTNSCKKIMGKWVSVYLYSDTHYLYKPCNSGYTTEIQITDKEIIIKGSESAKYKIRKKRKLSKATVKIDYIEKDSVRKYLEYTVIDKLREIAVFKFDDTYKLMVNAEKLREFPIIINDCKYDRANEFRFDTPNYKKLLSRYGK